MLGNALRGAEVEVLPGGIGQSPRKLDPSNSRLEYGDYRVRVSASGFASMSQDLRVSQPDLTYRFELQPGAVGCPFLPADIAGRVERNGHTGELWVKAVALRGIESSETRVSEGGFFLISGLRYTTYLLLIVEGDNVVHQQVVKSFPVGGSKSSSLSINLPK